MAGLHAELALRATQGACSLFGVPTVGFSRYTMELLAGASSSSAKGPLPIPPTRAGAVAREVSDVLCTAELTNLARGAPRRAHPPKVAIANELQAVALPASSPVALDFSNQLGWCGVRVSVSGGAREPSVRSAECNAQRHGSARSPRPGSHIARSPASVWRPAGRASPSSVGRVPLTRVSEGAVPQKRSPVVLPVSLLWPLLAKLLRDPKDLIQVEALGNCPQRHHHHPRHGSPTDAPESFDATHRVRSPPRFRRKSPPACDRRALGLRWRVFARCAGHPAVSGSRCRSSI